MINQGSITVTVHEIFLSAHNLQIMVKLSPH